MMDQPSSNDARPDVEITLPAAPEYLPLLRTSAATLAASIDFVIDDIEDLRIVVDEACSILLGRAIPGTALTCRFYVTQDSVTAVVRAHVLDPQPPPSGFAWTVLTSLTSAVHISVDEPDQLVIALTLAGSKTKAS